jgi:DNA-binding transcriptional ArsR family regulator
MRINLEKVLDILERPAYLEILLSVAAGKNYASSIARCLKKKQPTVTEQLARLESLRLVKPLSRGRSKKYEVNWDLLLAVFYDMIGEARKVRKGYLTREEKMVLKKDLEKIVPPDLIKVFLREYFETFLELGGKRKGFDEIIFSFFCALDNLDKSYWRKLRSRFKIDEKSLAVLARFMQFWVNEIEQTAFMNYLNSTDKESALKLT